MKIGIITHHYVKNFGAYMQAKALIEVIKSIKPDAEIEIVDYRVQKHVFLTSIHFIGFKFKRDTIRSYVNKLLLLKKFSLYEKKLPHSKRVYSEEDIINQKYDLLIVGSDEVWNFNDICYTPLKFGVGLSNKIKMISYAASVGGSQLSDGLPKKCIQSLHRFSAISVRDKNSFELVSKLLNVNPITVLDPVFLYKYDLQLKSRTEEIVNRPYILIYDCRLSEKMVKAVITFANENGYEIYGAGEYRKWYSSYTTNISPYEWAYMFKKATIVITGTFHGVSFSIKYNRNFVAYLSEFNRVQKVSSLLSDFGLGERIITTDNENELLTMLNKKINYNKANELLVEKVEKSINYLKENL